MTHATKPPPADTPAPAPTLPQQKADFTAEGAPPPGVVSNAAPLPDDTPPHKEHSEERSNVPKRETIKLKRSPEN